VHLVLYLRYLRQFRIEVLVGPGQAFPRSGGFMLPWSAS